MRISSIVRAPAFSGDAAVERAEEREALVGILTGRRDQLRARIAALR